MKKSEVFVHESAIVEHGAAIGERTNIWAFSHILSGANIGSDCNICDQVFIENDVLVGNRVTIKCGVQLWDGIEVEDDVFIGPNTTFTNDKLPRSKIYPDKFLRTHIGKRASLGANSTILPGLKIGSDAMIGAGAVVTKNVPTRAIVVGNPAKIVGYVDTKQYKPSKEIETNSDSSIVSGVKLLDFKHIEDMRGNLTEVNLVRDLPFAPRRIFFVGDVPDSRVRGEHAHKDCHECLICVHGSVSVIVDDGSNREEFFLDSVYKGLYLPPYTWRILYKYSLDAVTVVYASHEYDPEDYIRNYDDFLKRVRND